MFQPGDFAKYGDLIPVEHIPHLTRDFKKVPDFSWLLGAPHSSLDRLQGDILRSLPTVFLDDSGQPRARNFPALVLNNSCDLPDDRLESIAIAPVLDFHQYADFHVKAKISEAGDNPKKIQQAENAAANYLEDVRKNKISEILYLPAYGDFSNGAIVLLERICSIPMALYRRSLASNGRMASFTQSGFYYFLMKLVFHLARAESQEVERQSPDA